MHLYTPVVFAYDGKVMAAQHLAAPFGSVSALYAWDRLRNAIANIVIVGCRAGLAKWADYFFCAYRSDVEFHGMRVLDVFPERLLESRVQVCIR